MAVLCTMPSTWVPVWLWPAGVYNVLACCCVCLDCLPGCAVTCNMYSSKQTMVQKQCSDRPFVGTRPAGDSCSQACTTRSQSPAHTQLKPLKKPPSALVFKHPFCLRVPRAVAAVSKERQQPLPALARRAAKRLQHPPQQLDEIKLRQAAGRKALQVDPWA